MIEESLQKVECRNRSTGRCVCLINPGDSYNFVFVLGGLEVDPSPDSLKDFFTLTKCSITPTVRTQCTHISDQF